jgi:hypothetical protein
MKQPTTNIQQPTSNLEDVSRHVPKSERAFCSEFRVYAAKCGERPEPPKGGTPNGDSTRMRHNLERTTRSPFIGCWMLVVGCWLFPNSFRS